MFKCGFVRSNFAFPMGWCSFSFGTWDRPRSGRSVAGSGGGTRTRDAAIMSRVLCQLSYTAEPPYGLEP